MTAEILSLKDARSARSPHWAGTCVCLGCQHSWTGVGPVGHTVGLTCPECDLPKGVTKYLFGADVGDHVLTCAACGGDAVTAYRRAGHMYVRCMNCGNDVTDAFYSG